MNVWLDDSGQLYKLEKPLRPSHMQIVVPSEEMLAVLEAKPMTRADFDIKLRAFKTAALEK